MEFIPAKKLGFGLMRMPHLPIIETLQKVSEHFEH